MFLSRFPRPELAVPEPKLDDPVVDAQHIVDTLPQQTFDDMARIACSICNAGMAVVMQMERARPTLKAQWGIPPARRSTLLALCAAPVANPERVAVVATPTIAFCARVPLVNAVVGSTCNASDEPCASSQTIL